MARPRPIRQLPPAADTFVEAKVRFFVGRRVAHVHGEHFECSKQRVTEVCVEVAWDDKDAPRLVEEPVLDDGFDRATVGLRSSAVRPTFKAVPCVHHFDWTACAILMCAKKFGRVAHHRLRSVFTHGVPVARVNGCRCLTWPDDDPLHRRRPSATDAIVKSYLVQLVATTRRCDAYVKHQGLLTFFWCGIPKQCGQVGRDDHRSITNEVALNHNRQRLATEMIDPGAVMATKRGVRDRKFRVHHSGQTLEF
mmetsp:Transcript_19659/g.61035  ORF Transcript_19659/g.61035 Transcript_19659/m.61035 type:complete len:251 (-) Transcript_19659:40-792(-)